jgi:putative transcriptional regulator
MTPRHHPLPETLISFASGTLPDAMFAVVACHLTMCRICAEDIRRLELLGGILLQRIQAQEGEHAMAERVFARYLASGPPEVSETDQLLPPLLTRSLPNGNEIAWRRVSPGIWQHRIALPNGTGHMRLLRIAPGEVVHERASGANGGELVLVLKGRLSDAHGEYIRGDLVERTEKNGRELKAVGDIECVCLIADDPSAAGQLRHGLIELRRKTVPAALRVGAVLRQAAPLAAGLALLVGLGLGWLARGTPEISAAANLVSADGNRLIAQEPLQEALDTLPSGQETAASLDGRALRLGVKMTFEDQSGVYCRQYQITMPPSESYSGVACRRGVEWDVRIQALLPPASKAAGRTSPADSGAGAAMDAVVGAWIAGNPVVGDEEAALMRKDWRK